MNENTIKFIIRQDDNGRVDVRRDTTDNNKALFISSLGIIIIGIILL